MTIPRTVQRISDFLLNQQFSVAYLLAKFIRNSQKRSKTKKHCALIFVSFNLETEEQKDLMKMSSKRTWLVVGCYFPNIYRKNTNLQLDHRSSYNSREWKLC